MLPEMSIDEEINALRASVPGCSLVAFGDADTRLMLRSSHEKTCKREFLDELCAQARGCFEMLDSLPQETGGCDVSKPRLLDPIVLTPSQTRVFVRTESGGSDFLCCVCGATRDTEGLIQAAQQTLQKIEDGC